MSAFTYKLILVDGGLLTYYCMCNKFNIKGMGNHTTDHEMILSGGGHIWCGVGEPLAIEMIAGLLLVGATDCSALHTD